jgi:ATP-dependent DNA helicase RecQ
MGAPPLLALTATAPPELRDEIASHLFAAQPAQPRTRSIYVADPTRANLWLGVRLLKSEGDRRERLVTLAGALPGQGIIYMRSRRATEEVAAALRAAGIAASAYHAGVENRAAVQERFMRGDVRVIAATIAFGMGVNKADIRFILHGNLPASLEAYVQEVGRAGRDGKPAACLLLATDRELAQATQRTDESTPPALLEGVLQAVVEAVGTQRSGLLAADEVALALGVDDTALRVALSILEEAGLVLRDYDAPRSVSVYLRKAGRSADFARFLAATGLAPGKPVEFAFADLARLTQSAPARLEERLIAWQEAGQISFYPRGRALLVTLRAQPRDAAARLQRLVAARSEAHQKRAEAMVNYARTRTCRQVALAAALGGPPRPPCGACDQCGMPMVDALLRRP